MVRATPVSGDAGTSTPPALETKDLVVHYFAERGTVRAVDGVSFRLSRGETLGVVGESGCGKTTLGAALLRLLTPPGRIVSGQVLVGGTDIVPLSEQDLRRSIRWTKVSMVFQGAMSSLTPVYTVGAQMGETLQRHRPAPRAEEREIVGHSLAQVGLPADVVRRYPHELSGGMKQRVAIAMALFLAPAVVVLDEPTTALDVIVQAQILNLIKTLKRDLDISLVFITHDLAVEAEVADRIMVMYAGKVVEIGSNSRIYGAGIPAAGRFERDGLHPYTERLLAATPRLHETTRRPEFIPGAPPDLVAPPPGCRFHPRCPVAMGRCRVEEPPLIHVEDEHAAACWRLGHG